MSKEFIENRIDLAHKSIDEGNPQMAIGLLKNLKLRIHNEKIAPKLKTFEKESDERFETDVKIIQNSNKDDLRKEDDIAKRFMEWAKEYLDFYSKLNTDYEL